MTNIKPVVEKHRPDLSDYEKLYKHLHQNPELSTQEKETAQLITDRLKALSSDLKLTTNIGGYGQFAVLRNGEGPTVLLRADIDALPVLEKSGKEYSSKKKMVDDRDGVTKPVMHACGHDFHITSLLAAAETLIKAMEEWSGTIVFLFQPAEERGIGAQAMVDDGLYDEKKHACPIPDVVLGQHVFPIRAGKVATRPGPAMSAADSYQITVFGRGAHGSMPQVSIDPVLTACHIVTRLQGIVSREVPPNEMAVLTVGSVQAGEAENVIPEEAVIKLNMRTKSEKVRSVMRKAIERIVKAECVAGGCVKEPEIKETSGFPLTDNDPETVKKLDGPMKEYFGDDWNPEMDNALGSEDFNILGSAVGKPYCFWFFGGYDEDKYDALEKDGKLNEMPVNHSAYFAPALQPTLQTGADALCVAALTYLKKQ